MEQMAHKRELKRLELEDAKAYALEQRMEVEAFEVEKKMKKAALKAQKVVRLRSLHGQMKAEARKRMGLATDQMSKKELAMSQSITGARASRVAL